jgi:hypothetical protein
MECFWCLFSHWQPYGHFYKQDPAVFYVHICAYDGFSHSYLHGAGLLEKYAEVYGCYQEESLVLFVANYLYGYSTLL